MNNFCVLPFNSISITSDGKLRPCCNTNNYSYNFKVQDQDLYNILNNQDAVSLRSSFLNDEKDSRCDRCWKIENLSNKSFRHVANESVDRGIHTINFERVNNLVNYEDIKYLDITLGNKCNLACRMCNPYSSSLYAKQISMLNQYKGPVNIDFDRQTRDKLLEVIDRSVNLSAIYLLGGEPLINDFHDEIVDLLISKNRSKQITLHYSTNLQIDVEKYLELWSNFHIIELSVSLDGTDEVYEYIRWPGTWQKVYNNLKRVIEYKKSQNRDLLFPSVATTVQNLNAHNLPKLIEVVKSLDQDMNFYFIPVTGGNYLQLTPQKILEESIHNLSKIQDDTGRVLELVNFYKEAIETKHDRSLIYSFFEKQKSFDRLRNQNLFNTIPHFLEYALDNKIDIWN